MKKRIIITLILSIAIIIAMVWVADPNELIDSFSKTNLSLILIVIALYFANVFTKSLRWYLLVNSYGSKVPFSKTFTFFVLALGLNNVTPGKVGGEPVRAYLLKKEAEVPMGQGMASIFAERIMDLIVITTMAVIGAIIILPLLPVSTARILFAVLLLVIIGIIALLVLVSHSTMLERTVDKSVNLAMKVSKRDFIKKLSVALKGFVETFRFGMSEILKARKTAASCLTLTVIIWTNEAVRLFIILLALPDIEGGTVSLGAVFIASSIASILSLALPGGAGSILGASSIFIAVGMSTSDASAAGFLHVATSLWISVPISVIAIMVTGLKLSKISDDANSNKK